MLEAGTLDIALVQGEVVHEALTRHRPAAGQPQGADGDVSDRRHVRGARRQPLPLDRRSQGQADRLGRAGLGPGDPRPLCDGRAGPRCGQGFPADLSRARGRRAGDGARRPRRGAVGRRRRLAGLQDGDDERARRRASSRPTPSEIAAHPRQAYFPEADHASRPAAFPARARRSRRSARGASCWRGPASTTRWPIAARQGVARAGEAGSPPPQLVDTTAKNTLAAATASDRLHPGVARPTSGKRA